MAVMLGYEALRDALTVQEAIDLLEQAFARESAGATTVSPKFVTDFPGGSIRILFAADERAGYAAMKAYHNVKGAGTRYVVSLYSLRDGELLALLDGQIITDLRTGACSGVIGRRVPIRGPVSVGVIGSGNQARAQLASLAAVYRVGSVAVFSPTAAHRELFAHDMSASLGVAVTPVDSIEAAVRGRQVVASASNARGAEPVLRGAWLDECRLLCAVGNTRRQHCETDVDCFRNARLTIVDTLHAFEEAGELRQAAAANALPEAKRATLGQIVTGSLSVPGEGMIVFKSVGSALQDLALASRYYEKLSAKPEFPRGEGVGELRRRPWARPAS